MIVVSLRRVILSGTFCWLAWASPSQARFLQVDPVGYQDQKNLYAYVRNDPVNLVDPNGRQVVTIEERRMVAAGNLEGYWASREARGDPVASAARQYDLPSSQQSASVRFADTKLRTAIRQSVEREQGRPQLAVTPRPQSSGQIDRQVETVRSQVRQTLAEAHNQAVDQDQSGRPHFLSINQVTDYHHEVFSDFGLPPSVFGGTPVTGGNWEAPVTNALTGWCRWCDDEDPQRGW